MHSQQQHTSFTSIFFILDIGDLACLYFIFRFRENNFERCTYTNATYHLLQLSSSVHWQNSGFENFGLYNSQFIQFHSQHDQHNTTQTPLHYAALNNHVEAIKVLLQYGADVSAKTSHDMVLFCFIVVGYMFHVQEIQENTTQHKIDAIGCCQTVQ